jgi:hypothetical protein
MKFDIVSVKVMIDIFPILTKKFYPTCFENKDRQAENEEKKRITCSTT